MAEVRIEHIYNCDPDTVWDKFFFEEEYNRRLFKEELKFPAFEEISHEETDAEIRRSVNVVPDLGPLPGPLKALVGDGLGYREDGILDKVTKRYRTIITPNKMADKVTIRGEMWLEPAGAGKCKRIFICSITAKIFGVGGMLEKTTIENMKKSYEVGADFTNRYLAEKGL